MVPGRARSAGLWPAHPGSRHQTPPQPLQRGACTAIRNGQDLRQTGSPAQSRARGAAHHAPQPARSARAHAPIAKLVLLRLNDAIAGKPQRLSLEDMTVEHLLPRKPGRQQPVARRWFPDPAERDSSPEVARQSGAGDQARRTTRPAISTSRASRRCCSTRPACRSRPQRLRAAADRSGSVPQIMEREAELLTQLDRSGSSDRRRRHAPNTPTQANSPRRRRQPQPAARA